MSRANRRRNITHSLKDSDDPQKVLRPDFGVRVVMLFVGGGLVVLALMAFIAIRLM